MFPDGRGVREYGKHTNHSNHQEIYADMLRRREINESIDLIVEKSPETVHMLNTRYIFNRVKST